MKSRSALISRRQLLAGAGAGAAALLLETHAASRPSRHPARPIVFTHTTVVNVDAVQDDVALAVAGDRIAAIGPTDTIAEDVSERRRLRRTRQGAASRASSTVTRTSAATLERGFNEDFGFPNSARLTVRPASLLQGEESTLMVTIGALEAIRTGTTTIVENSRRHRPPRRRAGADRPALRVRGVDPRQRERGRARCRRRASRSSATPRFSPKLRDEGLQRINDLFTAWHGAKAGTHQRLPGRRARRNVVAGVAAGRPRLCREARSRLHDPPVAEPRRGRFHGAAPWPPPAGVSRQARLPRPAAVRRALPLRRRRRYRAARPLGHHRFAPGGDGREPRRHPADRQRCARPAARSPTAPTTTPTTCSR